MYEGQNGKFAPPGKKILPQVKTVYFIYSSNYLISFTVFIYMVNITNHMFSFHEKFRATDRVGITRGQLLLNAVYLTN